MERKKLTFIAFFACLTVASAFAQSTKVRLETNLGNITIQLFDDTPGHRDNFIQNVKDGMYDGVLFHRVIRNFMVQTGNPDTREGVTEKVEPEDSTQMGPAIPAEIHFPKHYHIKGMVAAAREGDDINPQKASSKYQFYIVTGKFMNEQQMMSLEQAKLADKLDSVFNQKLKEHQNEINTLRSNREMTKLAALYDKLHEDAEIDFKESKVQFFTDDIIRDYRMFGGAPWLDGDYTVFGEVTDGMKVVSKIEKAKTGDEDKPLKDIRIIRAVVE